MKTTPLTRLALVAILFLFVNASRAQINCPFVVTNNSNCDVTFDITIYANYPSCSPICYSTTNRIVPAGQSITYPCSFFSNNSCGNTCDIDFTITLVGGNSISPSSVTVNTGNPNAPFTSTAPCLTNNVSFASNGVTIN